jgi:hypothetical protein
MKLPISVIYILFSYTGVQQDLHMRLCLCRFTVTRQVKQVEQKLLTIQKHLRSSPVFSGVPSSC